MVARFARFRVPRWEVKGYQLVLTSPRALNRVQKVCCQLATVTYDLLERSAHLGSPSLVPREPTYSPQSSTSGPLVTVEATEVIDSTDIEITVISTVNGHRRNFRDEATRPGGHATGFRFGHESPLASGKGVGML